MSEGAVPVLGFLVVVGFALIALLFVTDAMLPGSMLVTSNRIGLPEAQHSDTIQILTETPVPAPDMTSQAVLAAQPSRSEPKASEKIKSAARGRHRGVVDKFSIKNQ
jgi:hypothetical protein